MAARRLGRARLGAVAIVTLSAAKGRMLNFDWFAAHRDFGGFFIRLAVGVRLIYGTADNVFSRERMTEFEQFLSAHGTPLASVGAPLSVYLQFVCGILFILGLGTRPAGPRSTPGVLGTPPREAPAPRPLIRATKVRTFTLTTAGLHGSHP